MSTALSSIQANVRPLLVLAAGLCLAVPAMAGTPPQAVPAGTEIRNTAVVSYVVDGHALTRHVLNTLRVDQLLDVTATWQNSGAVQAPAGSTGRGLAFRVGNNGNGPDSYALSFQVDPDANAGFTASDCRLYLDKDADGAWSHTDTPYPAPAPALDAGESMDVLAVCDIPADAPDQSLSHLRLDVVSNTFTGKPGAARTDKRGGVTLVVGMSGNRATATGTYAAANVGYAFTSTQQVTDMSGGQVATSGSRITYTLTVTPRGTATGRNLVVNTPIPAHTTYVPGSLALDRSALGDSHDDGDAGNFNATENAIRVQLGDIGGGSAARHIRFQVTIN